MGESKDSELLQGALPGFEISQVDRKEQSSLTETIPHVPIVSSSTDMSGGRYKEISEAAEPYREADRRRLNGEMRAASSLDAPKVGANLPPPIEESKRRVLAALQAAQERERTGRPRG